jgi:hypothetical protein
VTCFGTASTFDIAGELAAVLGLERQPETREHEPRLVRELLAALAAPPAQETQT